MTPRKVIKEGQAEDEDSSVARGHPGWVPWRLWEGLQPDPFLLSISLVWIWGLLGEGREGRQAEVHSNIQNFFQGNRLPLEGPQFCHGRQRARPQRA